jgi:LPXTG-motif cell wall-anchored protein
MRKTVFIFSLIATFFLGSLNLAFSQEQPKPKKDTVNIDTDAKPTFYYAAEDEKAEAKSSNTATIAIIAGIVVVIAVGGFILLKKKKK